MTPVQKAKHLILISGEKLFGIRFGKIDETNIDEIFQKFQDDDHYWDSRNDIRECGYETDINAPYIRNYDGKMIANQYLDESYIAWPVYYGGKYSNAEEIDWFNYAIDVAMTEKTVVVKTFKKVVDTPEIK